MNLEKTKFGVFEGESIDLFTFSNDNGMIVKITNYGATITDILLPGGKSIACGFDSLDGYFAEEYKDNAPYFGSTVGRYCSQIKDSSFSMDGKEYQLARNCGENNLHGGASGFDKKIWNAEKIEQGDVVGVKMSLLSKDMEEGFPGDVQVSVTFLLTNDNEIKIDYLGVPTQKTPLSMTNHTYFNLSGFKEDILGHKVTVLSDMKQEADDTGAATGQTIDVSGTPDDLRNGKLIGDVQEARGCGFENFYLTETNFDLKKVAQMEHAASGTKLEVSTTEPCMLFYTGIYTSDKLKRESGDQYGPFRGFCFETHRYQNGPNIQGSPKTFTDAGENFSSSTIFKLTF